MNFSGTLKDDGDGFECERCGDKIEQGQSCLRVDHAEVQKDERGEQTAQSQGYAGIFHVDCL